MRWLKAKVSRRQPCWRSSTAGAHGGPFASADREGRGGCSHITSARGLEAADLLSDVHTMCPCQAGMSIQALSVSDQIMGF
jgi:hypothetical protein